MIKMYLRQAIVEQTSMPNYSLNLPIELQQEAEKLAANQGISLDEFILSAVAEKVSVLRQPLNKSAFSEITYRQGASGQPVPVLQGTGLRVQTVVVAATKWGFSPQQIAAEYDIAENQVNEALAFYADNRQQIDQAIAAEQILEAANV